MARKVVCKICKSNGDTDTFYRVTDEKGISRFYCNQVEYENHVNENEKRYNLLKYIAEDILGYEDGQIVHPVLVKRIGEINKFYDYEVIHKCFELCKDDIQYWMGAKNFTSEYGMASYIMKIVEGKINDTFNKWKLEQRQRQQQDNNSIDLEIINEIPTKLTTKQDKGILEFLDEGDI
jgi:hypothetical protein